VLALVGLEEMDNGDFNVTWTSALQKFYQVEVSADLQTWADFGRPLAGSSGMSSLAAPAPTGLEADVILVAEEAAVRAFVPTADIGVSWRGGNEAAFIAAGGDAAWLSGRGALGYDDNPTPVNYLTHINLQVDPRTSGSNSIYTRFRFNVATPADLTALTLRMRVDDGFAAWINGQPVSSSRAPATPAWNSVASGSAVDDVANAFQEFPLAGPYPYLRAGENILAIQALNQAISSSDLLMEPMLIGLQNVAVSGRQLFWRVRVVPQL